jgi:hypothetical protein
MARTKANAAPRTMSKTDAIRAALAEGQESPAAGTAFIRERFGLEMSKQHFSATKSKLKSTEGQGAKAAAMRPEPPEERQPERRGGGEGDLLSAMEAMKPLVAALGAEKVKRIADLLG